jgi:hypothetical protein
MTERWAEGNENFSASEERLTAEIAEIAEKNKPRINTDLHGFLGL